MGSGNTYRFLINHDYNFKCLPRHVFVWALGGRLWEKMLKHLKDR